MKGLSEQQKSALIRRFGRRRRMEGAPAEGAGAGQAAERLTRFDTLEGYQRVRLTQKAARAMGLANPFFQPHEGVAGATTQIAGRACVNFANYNYLGLCGHPRVSAAAEAAIRDYGTSVSASRVVSGERPLHQALERRLADLYGAEDALVFVSGYTTNVATIGCLFGPRDLVVHDALIHNSALGGIQMSGAQRRAFPHNDWAALDRLLGEIRDEYERVLVVIEGLYSMDGDLPDLARFVEVKRRHHAFLMVDEAHALGVLGARGRGLWEEAGVPPADVDIWMGTLSKALASCGGYIAGESALVEHLRYAAPGFVYSVGLAPPLAAAALAALEVLEAEPGRVARLRANGRAFLEQARAAGIDTGSSAGASVIPAVCGGSVRAVRASRALLEAGVNVQPIIHPAVEERAARLRFFVTSEHREADIAHTVALLAEVLGVSAAAGAGGPEGGP